MSQAGAIGWVTEGRSATMDAATTTRIGRYKLLKVLGVGGMGEVLLAEDESLGRVAIKRPLPGADAVTLARFHVEKAAAGLVHPNIPRVYEVGEENGLPYIAMEFVDGEALNRIIATGKPLDLITKLSIMEQVCLALGHAHQQGIIHRDVKPANIIVQPNGVAKIIDFGIAKIEDVHGESITKTSQLVGTLHYIAPERFKNENVDRRSDIFSAGAVMYELLTGKLLFSGGENTAFYKIVNESNSSLSEYMQGYPPALDLILERALAKDPNQRYAYAEDFSDELHAIIEELKRTRVVEHLDQAERLTMEGRFGAATDLLNEALNLDPSNTQVRKLKKFVRDKQEEKRREERIASLVKRAETDAAAADFEAALASLNEALGIDPQFPGLTKAIESVEQAKKRHEITSAALEQAQALGNQGDFIRALQVLAAALNSDPASQRLLDAHHAMSRRSEDAERQWKVLEILKNARTALAAGEFSAVEPLLGDAEAAEPGHPEVEKLRKKALSAMETFLLDHPDRKDIEDLLQVSRQVAAARRHSLLVERCMTEVKTLVAEGRLEEAIRALESAVRETPDESLSKSLAAIVERRDAIARRFQLLEKRVTLLRGQGDLEEAIQLVQEENSASAPKNQAVQDLLTALTAERDQQEAKAKAIRDARDAMRQNNFQGAADVLQSVIRLYGESPEISREFDELHRSRAAFAKGAVGKSIQAARQAFLKNDASAALDALNTVTQVVEYADPATREDWNKISVSAHEAIRTPSTQTIPSVIAPSAEPEAVHAPAKRRLPVMIGGAVLVAAMVGFAFWKLAPSPKTQVPVSSSAVVSTPSESASLSQSGPVAATTPATPATASTIPSASTSGVKDNAPVQTPAASPTAREADVDDWHRVEHSSNAAEIVQYLDKHPGGVFRSQANARLEDLVWSASRAAGTSASLTDYLRRYPTGRYATTANDELAKLDLNVVRNSNDRATLEAMLNKYSTGDVRNEAGNRLDELIWAQSSKDAAGLQAYLGRFPNGKHASDAHDRLKPAATTNNSQPAAAPATVTKAADSSAPAQRQQPDDKGAILSALNAYQMAYDHQDLEAMEQIWPTMSDQQRKDTAKLFKNVKAVHLTFDVLNGPDVTGSTAVVTVSQINSVSVGGTFVPHTAKVVIRLKRRDAGGTSNGWYIESIH